MNPQVIMDGLVAGSMIGLGAVGITLTYSILRFANFAHGELISWGAYLALAVAGLLGSLAGGLTTPIGPFSFGWAVPIAAIAAVALNGGLALLIDWLLFGRLRRQRSTIIILVMASFGAALTLRSLLEFIFTSNPALALPASASTASTTSPASFCFSTTTKASADSTTTSMSGATWPGTTMNQRGFRRTRRYSSSGSSTASVHSTEAHSQMKGSGPERTTVACTCFSRRLSLMSRKWSSFFARRSSRLAITA